MNVTKIPSINWYVARRALKSIKIFLFTSPRPNHNPTVSPHAAIASVTDEIASELSSTHLRRVNARNNFHLPARYLYRQCAEKWNSPRQRRRELLRYVRTHLQIAQSNSGVSSRGSFFRGRSAGALCNFLVVYPGAAAVVARISEVEVQGMLLFLKFAQYDGRRI